MEERGRLMRRTVDIPDGLGVDELMLAAIDATRSTYPHPNPRVGAVIVSPDRSVLSSGVCMGDGLAHAEVNALEALDRPQAAQGSTVVVTLEPCSHTGRTGPCAEALIDAGVARVVIGALDPDPRVSGNGVQKLTDAGIAVEVGVHEAEVIAADRAYFHHRRTGLPFVTLKLASTIDGQVAAADGTSQWITGSEARKDAHRLRSQHDSVLVGAGTVLKDDPMLNVRLEDYSGPQPRPVVVSGSRDIQQDAKVLTRDPIVYRQGGDRADIVSVVKDLGSRNILSVLVEGGPTMARAFVDADAVDEFVWYIAGKMAGGAGLGAIGGVFETVEDAVELDISDITRLGGDIRVTATRRRGSD
jgi:diaminohydroxyphosphoribosylaminopyrimidine deaminase/5-amino-6-(5-phosphoribosylamino)uracil reductase